MRAPFRVVIITGASSGLGAALAWSYAAPGMVLGLCGRDRGRLEAVAQGCAERGARVSVAAIDVTDRAAMAGWLQEFDRAHPAELLVANAGTSAGPAPESASEGAATVEHQIRVNLIGMVNTVEPLLPALCGRGRGRLALVASIAAFRGLPYSPGYCASKAGLRAYGEALRARLEPRGVGVTLVCPGFFSSPMTDRFDGPTPFLASTETAARKVKRGLDRGRRRISFPWPLVFGLKFCDVAPALVGDMILRRFRFHIHSA